MSGCDGCTDIEAACGAPRPVLDGVDSTPKQPVMRTPTAGPHPAASHDAAPAAPCDSQRSLLAGSPSAVGHAAERVRLGAPAPDAGGHRYDCKAFVPCSLLHASARPLPCSLGFLACMAMVHECMNDIFPSAMLAAASPGSSAASMEQQRSVVSPAHGAGTLMAAPGPQQTATPAKPPPKACANCRTAYTPCWRQDPVTGSVLCNACRQYYDRTGFHRPLQLVNNTRVRFGAGWSIRPCITCMCARAKDDDRCTSSRQHPW